ncbi:deoxyribodipyrimidine photo-lyase [Kineococcus sp. SYSU DK001]|uniref:deoxyribodipyrimidine photo-lyase n=1 Tax=Kineococcus sp. SYSU DK001 TaxID=3383122 RepID=UPI003D7C6B9A
MTTVVWLRDELFLENNAAVAGAAAAAVRDGDRRVVPLVVVRLERWVTLDASTRRRQLEALRTLDDALDDQLLFQHGEPAQVLRTVVRAASATEVHVASSRSSADLLDEEAVEAALDVPLVRHAPATSTSSLAAVRWWMPVDCHGYPPTV